MTDIYCGMGDVPTGKKLGTAKQCLDKRQVRHYGVEAIPNKLANKSTPSLAKINKEKNKIFAAIKGLEKRYNKEKETYLRKKEKNQTEQNAKVAKQLIADEKKLKKLKEKHTKICRTT